MKKTLKKLEHQARILDPEAKNREAMRAEIVGYAERFLQELDDQKAFEASFSSSKIIPDHPISEEGESLPQLLTLLREGLESGGLNPPSGRHMGYIPGGGLYASALGDFLAAVTNRYAGVFFSAPGAVRIEEECVQWMCRLTGYPESAGGTLTSGGSIANLTAVVTARDAAGLKTQNIPSAVIYTTSQAHHCLDKAYSIAGLKEAVIRTIPTDNSFRMRPEALARQIETDKQDGLRPFLLVASAGTTDTGAVDPIKPLADIAKQHQLWLHVDAAYGGAFLLTKYGKNLMAGIEHADSVIIDPHKGFFLPYGTGALLVKDKKKLYESQHMTAGYMQDTLKADELYSPTDLSPELSRHFRGLRMWLPLKLYGIGPFRSALEEKRLLTEYFYRQIQQIDGIETGPKPELSVTIFRYCPDRGDADDFNRKLVKYIHEDGRIFLSSTTIDGTVWLRMAIVGLRTHLKEVEEAIGIIREKIREVENQAAR